MSFFENKQESRDYHIFSTDNQYMNQLGLGSFTTGILYDWWYTKGRGGEYVNRRFIPAGASDIAPRAFFGIQSGPFDKFEGIADGDFEAWQFSSQNQNRGQYVNKKVSTWDFFDYWKAGGASAGENSRTIHHILGMSKADLESFDRDIIGYGNLFQANPKAEYGYDRIPLLSPNRLLGSSATGGDPEQGLDWITSLINANNYIRWKKVQEPDLKKWDKSEVAYFEFLDDIITSRSGCVNIPVSVAFDLAPQQLVVDRDGNQVICTKEEEFTINLFLFDELNTKGSEPTAVMAHTKHAGVPVSSIGQAYRDKKDGESTGADEQVLSDQVAGDIDLFYNEFTGKWSSGGKQVLAKVVSQITAAEVPGLEALKESDIAETLSNPDEDAAMYTMGTGVAMPINMQNANQYQWTPSYLSPAECRKDDKTKVTLEVQNPSSRVYDPDETVLLFEVDGVWMPMPYASGADFIPPNPIVEGRWEFIQFATDIRHFFQGWPVGNTTKTDINISSKYNFKNAEEHFHASYYRDDTNNKGFYGIPEDQYFHAIHGYDQMTSFDFMDENVAGLRGDKRSIANTVWGQDATGASLEGYQEDSTQPRGWMSTFFGAVFPDGYTVGSGHQGGNPEDYTKERDYNVKAAQLALGVNDGAYQYFSPTVFDSGVLDETTGTAIPKEVIAFGEGDIGTTAGTKQAPRSALYNGPLQEPLDEDDTVWERVPPMFARVVDNADFTVPHLPADIALNGSPEAQNGGPLTNLSLYKYIHEYGGRNAIGRHYNTAYGPTEKTGDQLHDRPNRWTNTGVENADQIASQEDFFRQIFFNYRHNWLYKSQIQESAGVGGDGGDEEATLKDRYTPSDSAFDFKPINNSRIQFRPLKFEVYCNQILTDYGAGSSKIMDLGPTYWVEFDHDEQGNDAINKQHREYLWYWLNWHMMNDGANARGISAILREANANWFDGGGRIQGSKKLRAGLVGHLTFARTHYMLTAL